MLEKLKPCPFCGGDVKIINAEELTINHHRSGGERVMASCKDCLYYEPCSVLNAEFKKHPKDFIETDLCAKQCTTFKDRSRFVELPQSVHLCDAVHFVLKGLDEIDLQEYTFTVGKNAVSDTVQFITEIGTYGFWVGESPREFAPDYDDFYYWYELGETVFLSREEAEKALKERDNSDM